MLPLYIIYYNIYNIIIIIIYIILSEGTVYPGVSWHIHILYLIYKIMELKIRMYLYIEVDGCAQKEQNRRCQGT